MAKQFFEHQIAYITARIEIKGHNKNSIGTGFFYLAQVPLNDETIRAKLLLISNKHVFLDSNRKLNSSGKLTISLNRKKEDGTPEFGNVRTFVQDGFENLYAHPDPEVDLACIDVSGITKTDAFYKYLDSNLLKEISYEHVAAGSEVIFAGYPNNQYDVANNLPLIRRGWIASMPDVDFNGRGQVVIDAQIFPGSSGSPVFAHWDQKYSLLGVVSETMIRHSQLQTLPTNMQSVGVAQILGLGIVIKQRHVQELIDYTVNEVIRRVSPNS